MTYQETLYALLRETKNTTIFALNSFGDAEIGMGFRRACVYSDLKDPIIDGVVFMLAADAWNTIYDCPITSTFDMECTPTEDIEIRLRAVSGFPYTEINLGKYRVTNFEPSEEGLEVYFLNGVHVFPSFIRLDIERIS